MDKIMKIIVDKLSAYEILNNIIPGILFCNIASKMTRFSFTGISLLENVIIYYFVGVVIGRIGSLFWETILKKKQFVTYAPYEKYIVAEQMDAKISILNTTNNMYRSFMAVGFCGLLVILIDRIYGLLVRQGIPMKMIISIGSCVFVFLMFLFAYKKQTNYICKRVETNLKNRKVAESEKIIVQ